MPTFPTTVNPLVKAFVRVFVHGFAKCIDCALVWVHVLKGGKVAAQQGAN
jgi:hypothetical protein